MTRIPSKSWHQMLFTLACLACAIPVMWATYPPMVDVPQHAAQIAGIRGTWNGSWSFAHLFDLKLFTPYWLGYGLVLVLSYVTSTLLATKIVVAASACLLPWTIARFCNKAGTDPRWNWLFLLLPFGFAYDWGFLNFYIAIPLAFLFLSVIVDSRRTNGSGTWLKIALWLHFLFFAHVLVTAFFCVIAVLLLAEPWEGLRTWLRRSLPLATILPLTLAWLTTTIGNVGSDFGSVSWDYGPHRLADLLPAMVAAPSTLPGYLIAAFALASPLVTGARPSVSPWRWLPFALYVAWMLLSPHHIFGNSYTYQRFGNLGLPLYFLCFQPGRSLSTARAGRIATAGIVAISTAMLSWQTVKSSIFNSETESYARVIQHAEPGRRLLMLNLDRGSQASQAPIFLHFPAWYQAQQGGLVEFNFARFEVTPLSYRSPDASRITIGFEWSPHTLMWRAHNGDLYDYFLVRSPNDESAALARISECRTRLIANERSWWLYARETRGNENAVLWNCQH